MARYPIYSKAGDIICYTKSLERVGKWMGERYVVVDVSSPSIISFGIGDYIIYSGEKFTLGYDPAVNKQSSSGSGLGAFLYNGIKFQSCVNELTRIRFLDCSVELDENETQNIHFVNVPSFSFICNTLQDFAEKLQANLTRWNREQKAIDPKYMPWQVTLPETYTASTNVVVDINRQSVWDSLENVTKKFNATFTVRDDMEHGMKLICLCDDGVDLLGVNAMRYGMGNGLLSIERVNNNSKPLITRLRAYGSTANLPLHYYGEPYEPWYRLTQGVDFWIFKDEDLGMTTGARYRTYIVMNVLYSENHADYSVYVEGYPGMSAFVMDERRYVSKTDPMFGGYGSEYDNMVLIAVLFDKESEEAHAAMQKNGAQIVFKSGIPKKYTTRHTDWWVTPYFVNDNNMAVRNLMLPEFNMYKAERGGKMHAIHPKQCELVYGNKEHRDWITSIRYKNEDYAPVHPGDGSGGYQMNRVDVWNDAYIDDEDLMTKYGLAEGDVYFDDANNEETGDIHPTIEGVTQEQAKAAGYNISLADGDNGLLDEFAFSAGQYYNGEGQIKDAPTLDANAFDGFVPFGTEGYGDDGVMRNSDPVGYWSGMRKQFYIFTKDLGFDLKDYLGEKNAAIIIKSGRCAGRRFELVDSTKNPLQVIKDGVKYWRFWCNRVPDETLHVYYPNNMDNISGVAVPEQRPGDKSKDVNHSDRFVFDLDTIEMPRAYIDIASARLKEAAKEYLKRNNRAKYMYVPKIDNINMKRDRDLAMVTGEKCYHDVLREGLLMNISDDDLGVHGGVDDGDRKRKFHIETLSVKEQEDKIPEYSIVLKEEAEFTPLQKLEKQIATITRVVNNITSGNSNVVVYSPMRTSYVGGDGSVNAGGSVSAVTGVSADEVMGICDGRYARLDVESENVFEGENRFERIVGGGGFATVGAVDGGLEDDGAAVYELDGAGYVATDYLNVRRAAFFRTLTIAEVEHMGGEVILSAAACQIAYVERGMNGWDCFFEKEANGRKVHNEWQEGDFAYCRRWNTDEDQAVFYWRRVMGVREEGNYHVVTLADSDGVFTAAPESGVPAGNDTIVLLGCEYGGYRSCAQVYSTIGVGAPSRRYYYGITTFSLSGRAIEMLEHTVDGVHWHVGGGETNYIDYDGGLHISASDVRIESVGSVGDALGLKFEILHSNERAPVDMRTKRILERFLPTAIDVSKDWTSAEIGEHEGDCLLTTDGVSYFFKEGYWCISADRHLLNAMNFVSGFESSKGFAKLFTKITGDDGSVEYGYAGTFVDLDKDGNVTTAFNVETGLMTVNCRNFTLDKEGFVTLSGLLRKGHLVIDAGNYGEYFGSGQTMDLLETNAGGYNYIEFRYVDDGDVVLLPSFNSGKGYMYLTEKELDGVREYIGQDVVIYNNTNTTLRVQGIFFEGFDHTVAGRLVFAQRLTEVEVGGGKMMCAHCMATTPPTVACLEEDLGGELVWWNVAVRTIHRGAVYDGA